METNAPMIIDYDDSKMIATLKQTVAVGLNNEEFQLFSQFCKATGLNPFKKEIWAIKAGGRLQLMTGINGFFEMANRNPQFDGYESGLIGKNGELLSGAYPGSDFIGAWAKVYRKDRRIPTEGIAMLSEYDKGQGNWPKMKRVMILKCAESVALRKSFPQDMNGLYTAEEMPAEYTEPRAPMAARPVAVKAEVVAPAPKQTSILQAIKDGTAYEYDIKKLTESITDAETLAFLKQQLKKAEVSMSSDKTRAYTLRPVDDMVAYLMNDVEQPPVDDDAPDWMEIEQPELQVSEDEAKEQLKQLKAKKGGK